MSGWWTRVTTELRSLFVDPNTPASLGVWGLPSVAGEPVNTERALSLTAVWSCVALLSGTISSCPLILYRKTDAGRERAESHPLYDVLKTRPNPTTNVVAFWESMVVSLLLHGNAFATLSRDDTGAVRSMWWLNPSRVRITVRPNGTPEYEVSTPSGPTTISARMMLHVAGPVSADGITGRSIITVFRETLGAALGLERYGAEWFSNGAQPSGVLSAPTMLSPGAITKLRDSVDAAHRGPGRHHRMLVLESGMKFEAVSISPEDSQWLGARRFSTEEIARIFNVPAYLIGGETQGGLTYSTAETRAIDFLRYSLTPWLSRIEAAITLHCIAPSERNILYPEFQTAALLSTDTQSRYNAYKTGVEGGWLTIDEVRAKESLPPLPVESPAGE